MGDREFGISSDEHSAAVVAVDAPFLLLEFVCCGSVMREAISSQLLVQCRHLANRGKHLAVGLAS